MVARAVRRVLGRELLPAAGAGAPGRDRRHRSARHHQRARWPSSAPRTTRCAGLRRSEPVRACANALVAHQGGAHGGPGKAHGARPVTVGGMQAESRSGRVRRQRGNRAPTLPDSFPDSGLLEDLPARELHRGLFHLLFGREPAPDDPFVAELEQGTKSPRQMMEWLIHSAEWSHSAPMTEFGPSLHYGRGRLHPQPAAGTAHPRHRWRGPRRPLRRTRPDGLSLRVRGDRHRRPAERGPSRALPGRPDTDDGRRRRRAGRPTATTP